MQDWRAQARKNSVEVLEIGSCQFCGAPVDSGVSECVDIAGNVTHKIDHKEGIKNMTIFLCVDAHALQHPEIHGRWSNHFHLSRLELILNDKIYWNYRLSTILSSVVDDYKNRHKEERILPPKPGSRGFLSVYDIDKTQSNDEYIQMVDKWAGEVYKTYIFSHPVSKKIAKLFKEKISSNRN